MDIPYIHSLFLQCRAVSIDTRKIEPQSLFVAIKGEKFDANAFAKEALDKGASYVIIDNADYFLNDRTILVSDSLIALQELSRYHRNYLKLPIIALTGSNGKTTTKELINVVLSTTFKTGATIGNLNNHIGVPLTLLSFNNQTQIGIVEMGANHQKEIEFLCSIAQPDFGYITNFGKAHLEGFGGVEGVIKGKSEMYDYLSQNDKMAFVNLEDTIQVQKTETLKKFTFGVDKPQADVNISEISANPFVTVVYNRLSIQSQLIGLYNANNINAAISIGKYFGVADVSIQQAIEGYVPENNRSQLISRNTNTIILDAYNANPSSMAVAIKNWLQLPNPNKVAILGDMFELGQESLPEHAQIVASLLDHTNVMVLFVGKDFYTCKKEVNHLHFFETYEKLANYLSQKSFEQTQLLIKGSRGMALERAVELL